MMNVHIQYVPINNRPIPVDESTDFGPERITNYSLKVLLRYFSFKIDDFQCSNIYTIFD